MNIHNKSVRKAVEMALANSVLTMEGKPDKVRKFDETLDMIVNVRDVDIRNPNNRIDQELLLPNPIPNNNHKKKVCFITKDEMEMTLREQGYAVLNPTDLDELSKKSNKDKKDLAKKYTYFVARADLMRDLAKVLARFLGQQGKMPRPQPKGFGVIRPNEDIDAYTARLGRIIKVSMKKQLMMQLKVAKKSQSLPEIMENVEAVLSFLETALPMGNNNVKSIFFKTSMGLPAEVEDSGKGGR